MANPIYEFREWLLKRRFFRVAWFAKDPKTQPDTDAALVKLPKALANQLIEAANQLSVPEQERSVILEAIHGAIAKWKANPDVSENSIVVLGSPVSSVSRLLAESLPQLDLAVSDEHDEEKDSPLSVHLLDWVERPPEVKAIRDQIQDKLGLPQRMDEPQLNEALDDSPSSTADAEAQQSHPEDEATTAQHLMIIPNLCWCFLRSAEGLDGLDYLQDWLPQDSRQFWVMGSGQVGWEYLNATLMFGAYCGSTINLPSLSGEDLQQWLWPLVERFDVEFVDRALHRVC